MDRCLPMRIGYYTGWLRPETEGTSREVFALARHFKARFILGLNQMEFIRILWKDRALGLNSRAYYILKAGIPLLDWFQQLAHVYDSLDCWHYLRNLKRRPIILTATSGTKPLPMHFYDRVAALVVDSEARREEMLAAGFPNQRVRIIYPGLDLDYYQLPEVPDDEPFKVLFASAPPMSSELQGRGVWQILDAAQRLPDYQFILVWRSWGNSQAHVRERLQALKLPNVHLVAERFQDMRVLYRQVHCVVAPFHPNGGKSCPTSIVEACACGRPVIVGHGVGIRHLIANEGAGLACGEAGTDLADALRAVRKNFPNMSQKSRALAEKYFNSKLFYHAYASLYCEVLESPFIS